jgi:hypothetical protein
VDKNDVEFDGGAIHAALGYEVRCVLPSGEAKWTTKLPIDDHLHAQRFSPDAGGAQVVSGMLLVVRSFSQSTSAEIRTRELHRIAEGGEPMWHVTPDGRAEGMFLLMTTTGLVVIAPWDEPCTLGGPPPLAARLLDPDTGATRAHQSLDPAAGRLEARSFASVELRRSAPPHARWSLIVSPRVSWGFASVAFAAEDGARAPNMLPETFGVPLP